MPQTSEQRRASMRAWYAANKEKQQAYARQYRKDNPRRYAGYEKKHTEQKLAWRKANPAAYAQQKREGYYKRTYGLTAVQVDAMFEAQNFCCAICKTDDIKKRHIDHCHTTGKVRSILCGNCNFGLGHARDNPAVLRAMATYLEHHHPEKLLVKKGNDTLVQP